MMMLASLSIIYLFYIYWVRTWHSSLSVYIQYTHHRSVLGTEGVSYLPFFNIHIDIQ